ncbi:hypothetical protein UlMin_015682 [Ulmus minor]
MESESILQFLENKTLLVTGSTGLLGKALVEKILRVQPNVKKLYLLLRASDSNSANQRMHSEVLGKEVFRVLRQTRGNDFESFISEKLVAVDGDVSYENLGIKDFNLREQMWKDLDFIVNSAATTNFYERYDVSLATNTSGVLNVLNFAKKCVELKLLLHVSTAYVCGEKEGLILEKAFHMGETLKKTCSKLDFDMEKKLVVEKLNKLQTEGAAEATITRTMRDFGMERAKLFGWPNTYVFSKAMGEMCLLEQSKDNLPVVIIRPTMITSTYKEPFPGWIEGLRTIDSVIVGYGKGAVTCFVTNPKLIFDLIPVDLVINAIIMAIVVNGNQLSNNIIYHIGSSLRNPVNVSQIHAFLFKYFTKHPLTRKNGELIKVDKATLFNNMTTFQVYMAFRYRLPLKMLQLVNIASFQYFGEVYKVYKRKLKTVMRLVNLYRPYLLSKGTFDDINSEELRLKAQESCSEVDMLNFDPKCIDWEDYIINTHIPGLQKYVIN